jgi:hypothetical protein
MKFRSLLVNAGGGIGAICGFFVGARASGDGAAALGLLVAEGSSSHARILEEVVGLLDNAEAERSTTKGCVMPSELPFDNMKRLDAEFEVSTLRPFVDALRSGKTLPDFSRMRRDLHKIAKNKG